MSEYAGVGPDTICGTCGHAKKDHADMSVNHYCLEFGCDCKDFWPIPPSMTHPEGSQN